MCVREREREILETMRDRKWDFERGSEIEREGGRQRERERERERESQREIGRRRKK